MLGISANPLAGLLPGPSQTAEQWVWATVTHTSPLRIRLDGETQPLAASPGTMVPVAVGDRVRVHFYQRRMIIHGKATNPSVGADTVTVGGQTYRRSGVIDAPAPSWDTRAAPVYVATLVVTMPFSAPPGWTFQIAAHESAGFTFVQRAGSFDARRLRVRALQVLSTSTTALKSLAWTLIEE